MPRRAIRARLERHHVHAFGGAVGHLRALTSLEVQAIEVAREIDDRVNIETDHPFQGTRRSRQALEGDVDARVAACAVLLDDVREDAVAGRQLEDADDTLEELLEADDGLDVVSRGIETDDDVAASVRQSFENREQDLGLVVSGTVRLDARAEVLRRANGDSRAVKRVEEARGR